MAEPDWVAITKRNARSVQTTIGWIFWDPGAVARYEALGLPGPLGYIGARAAPLAPAGPDAVIAAFGSISPLGVRMAFLMADEKGLSYDLWRARDEAVREGPGRARPGDPRAARPARPGPVAGKRVDLTAGPNYQPASRLRG